MSQFFPTNMFSSTMTRIQSKRSKHSRWGHRGGTPLSRIIRGRKYNRKTSTSQILGFSAPDYKITIFTMIKKIKQTVANVIRELYTLKCGIAEVKRSQIAVVHLKTVNKKFNGQIFFFFFFQFQTLYWQRFQSLCHHLVAFIKSQTAGMLGGKGKNGKQEGKGYFN